MSKLADEFNEILIREYISKVECCDECFASVYCTVNGLRESRVPQEYCVNNIKRYFGDKVKPVYARPQGKWTNLSPFDEEGLCSVCGGCYPSYYRFCPLCGADMRRGEEE